MDRRFELSSIDSATRLPKSRESLIYSISTRNLHATEGGKKIRWQNLHDKAVRRARDRLSAKPQGEKVIVGWQDEIGKAGFDFTADLMPLAA